MKINRKKKNYVIEKETGRNELSTIEC
ncbi:IS630 transposase-related protein [Synechocystis sp. PCC 6803]